MLAKFQKLWGKWVNRQLHVQYPFLEWLFTIQTVFSNNGPFYNLTTYSHLNTGLVFFSRQFLLLSCVLCSKYWTNVRSLDH